MPELNTTATIRSAVCACARDEGQYIEEWIDYHLDLGFGKIIIYDNNPPGDNSLPEQLARYVSDSRVEIVDYRGRVNFQVKAYNDCLKRHRKDLDWIAFIDVDEFITFSDRCMTAGQYLEEAVDKKADVIYINWLLFGDSGKVRKEPGGVLERFTVPARVPDYENCHIKSIVRTSSNVRFGRNPHNVVRTFLLPRAHIVNGSLIPVSKNSPRQNIDYKVVCLRHYVTKTVEEYILQKSRRGAPDCKAKKKFSLYTMDRFYAFNERTPEKDRVAKELIERL